MDNFKGVRGRIWLGEAAGVIGLGDIGEGFVMGLGARNLIGAIGRGLCFGGWVGGTGCGCGEGHG